MMIAGTAAFFISEILPSLTHSKNKMLGISRMSMNWSLEEIIKLLNMKKFSYDKTYADIIRNKHGYYSSFEFFKLLGFKEYDDLDFDIDEGCNIVHNLNMPLPEKYHQQYDFVFENGTIEHIFDIKNAVSCTAHAVKVGGYVLHCSPLDSFNHGFYNFSINFFHDFYRANGFTDMQFYLIRTSSEWYKGNFNIRFEKFAYTHEEFYIDKNVYSSDLNKLSIAFFSKKIQHFETVQIPIQAAYNKDLNISSRLNAW